MLRDDPIEWARLCREQAELTSDPKIAGLLVQLAEQCEALAQRINSPDLNGTGKNSAGDGDGAAS
jgi:hypothetical protein